MFEDAFELFVSVAKLLKEAQPERLERIVLMAVGDKLAYADDRRYARDVGFDFWEPLRSRMSEEGFRDALRGAGVAKPYSASNLFPDFLFRTEKRGGELIRGSVLELKDSAGGSIASFNSTIPTRWKTLEEIDAINGACLGVTDRIPDGWNSAEPRGLPEVRAQVLLPRADASQQG